jgi:hypothetical protein
MPKYTEILPDGTRRVVHYRMKDCPVMREIRLKQMAARLARQLEQGVITPIQRRHIWEKTKHSSNRKFAPVSNARQGNNKSP